VTTNGIASSVDKIFKISCHTVPVLYRTYALMRTQGSFGNDEAATSGVSLLGGYSGAVNHRPQQKAFSGEGHTLEGESCHVTSCYANITSCRTQSQGQQSSCWMTD